MPMQNHGILLEWLFQNRSNSVRLIQGLLLALCMNTNFQLYRHVACYPGADPASVRQPPSGGGQRDAHWVRGLNKWIDPTRRYSGWEEGLLEDFPRGTPRLGVVGWAGWRAPQLMPPLIDWLSKAKERTHSFLCLYDKLSTVSWSTIFHSNNLYENIAEKKTTLLI